MINVDTRAPFILILFISVQVVLPEKKVENNNNIIEYTPAVYVDD